MIRRTNRFHGLGSLGFLLRKGRIVRGTDISLRYIVNSRRDSYRASVAVSRKVSKSAVVRNRMRRRIYEVIRKLEPDIGSSYDLLFVVHNESLSEIPIDELAARILSLLQQSGVITRSDPSVKTPDHAIVITKEK